MHTDSAKLPQNIKPISQILDENPTIKNYAKYFNSDRFERLGFFVISQPQTHLDVQMYGLFTIDKDNVKSNVGDNTNRDEIKQDFIAYKPKEDTFVYYSGLDKKKCEEECQHIDRFCEEYGYWPDGTLDQYSVYHVSEKKLQCKNHHYRDENAQHLPSEPWIRKQVIDKLYQVRNEFR